MSILNEFQHLKISFGEIIVATENFKTLIGRGGYGLVYKGKLLVSGKETRVAVKRLNEQFGQGLKEFLTEILLLSGQKHPNLISLVGFCNEGKEKSIVYEYAEHGGLDQYIRRTRGTTSITLTWLQRLKICADAARGLYHLHDHLGGHRTIIHRDIKSSNILIDENWVGKISDLGLSKLSVTGFGMTAIVSNGFGTQGYCEPEYFSTGVLTKKSDVYSFGIVLFEVLCGRLCIIDNDDGFSLSGISAKEHYKNNSLDKIIDQNLREHMGSYSMNKFAAIAYRCLHDDREQRPAMDVVLKELEEALKIQRDSFGRVATPGTYLEEWQHLKIPFGLIKVATENFKTFIGKGGYGLVFKGKLLVSGKETMVAVKRLNDRSDQGFEEFLMEVKSLSGQKHPNLVSLVGFCNEKQEKSIVYEYVERGSLDQHIRRRSALTWLQRIKICIDAARGLDYLHHHLGGDQTIIHRDIKSSNILIDECWVAKISDFGLSKLGFGTSVTTTNPCGTRGYCEPEYGKTGFVTRKSDVYSFGVVLFEVLCGRLCHVGGNDGFTLTSTSATYHYENNTLDRIIDDSLREHIGSDSMTKFAAIAYKCLHDDREQRPAMDVVLKELEGTLKYQVSS